MLPYVSDQETSERGAFAMVRQHAPAAIVGALGLLGFAVVAYMAVVARPGHQAQAQKTPAVIMVQVQPLTPPPPPLPPQQTIQPPKFTAAPPLPNTPAPPRKPAPAVGTSIQGHGQSNEFDLSGTPGGIGLIGGGAAGGGGGSGSGWSYYNSMLQTQITQALEKNPQTRFAVFQIVARIWIDAGGTVTNAVVGTTGDSAVDGALRSQLLIGTRYPAAPPAGMPMPIFIRITGQRPSNK